MQFLRNTLCLVILVSTISLSGQRPVVLVEGSTKKIEQLIGDFDRERQVPTQNRTFERYNLHTTDLGVPFQHDNKTYVCFGDIPPFDGDPLGYTTDNDPEDGIKLDFVTNTENNYRSITIPGVSMAGFEVPMEGVSWDNIMYMYCTTNTMTQSVLAKSTDNGQTFTKLYDVSNSKFINLNLVKRTSDDNYPVPEGSDIQVMFGSGKYRESSVYLAFQPGTLIEQKSIYYYYGTDDDGKPMWSPFEIAAMPLFDQPCVGELSVSYNNYIKQWIMTYNCINPRGINCRVADDPWGPWSDPFVIFDPEDGYCHFMHANWDVRYCDDIHDPGREYEWGGEYGPYQFDHLATGKNGETTIYYTMSTWNPYTVVLMKSTLKDLSASDGGIETLLRDIQVFPNPSRGNFRIIGANMDETFHIYSITGNLVQSGTLDADSSFRLNKGLGVFFLKLLNDPTRSYKLIVN